MITWKQVSNIISDFYIWKLSDKKSYWVILIGCNPISGYFMPRSQRIAFTVHSYFSVLWIHLSVSFFFLHTVLLNTNNFWTDVFWPIGLTGQSVLDMTLNNLMAKLQIWRMWSMPSLPLLPGSYWLGVVAPDRVLSLGQIEQTVCKQMTDVELWLLDSNTLNHLTVCK